MIATPTDAATIARTAKELTETARQAMLTCGDVADSFPCKACPGPGFKNCRFSIGHRREAGEACEHVRARVGRLNFDAFNALRAHLTQEQRHD